MSGKSSADRLTRAQRRVLERMAAGECVVVCSMTKRVYASGTPTLRWATFSALLARKLVSPDLAYVASNRELSEVYGLTPAGRAAVKGERDV